MPNMSHCRFYNTLGDLADCRDALDESGLSGLSEAERKAAIKLRNLCAEIAHDYRNIEDED